MVDIHFTKERPRARPQCIVDLCSPTAVLLVYESCGDETPKLSIPTFVNRVAVNRIEKCACSDPFAAGPPISVSNQRIAVPVESIIKAAFVLVPPIAHRLLEKRLRAFREPIQLAAAQLP